MSHRPGLLGRLRRWAQAFGAAPGQASQTREVTLTVEERLQLARARLLGGRGPGASRAEVVAHTRDRASIAGIPVVERLELTARQTSRAREDASGQGDRRGVG